MRRCEGCCRTFAFSSCDCSVVAVSAVPSGCVTTVGVVVRPSVVVTMVVPSGLRRRRRVRQAAVDGGACFNAAGGCEALADGGLSDKHWATRQWQAGRGRHGRADTHCVTVVDSLGMVTACSRVRAVSAARFVGGSEDRA